MRSIKTFKNTEKAMRSSGKHARVYTKNSTTKMIISALVIVGGAKFHIPHGQSIFTSEEETNPSHS